MIRDLVRRVADRLREALRLEGTHWLDRPLPRSWEDPNIRDRLGETDLHVAAEHAMLSTLGSLVVGGADANARDRRNETPLHRAVWGGHLDAAKALLDAGADPDAIARSLGSPLEAAVSRADLEMVRLLLEHGADVNGRGKRDGGPLAVAASWSAEALLMLLDAGADARNPYALYAGAMREDPQVLQILLDHGADLSARTPEGNAAVHGALGSLWPNRGRMVEFVLTHGGDPNALDAEGYSPLYRCALGRDLPAAALLLKFGANVNSPLWSSLPLDEAIRSRNDEMVRLLREHGARSRPTWLPCLLVALLALFVVATLASLMQRLWP